MKLGALVGEGTGYFVYGSIVMFTSDFKAHNPANPTLLISALGFGATR